MARLKIVVMGYLVRGPFGGLSWHYLHYVTGLAAMGHDVWYIEDSDDYPGCWDWKISQYGTDPSSGLGFASRALTRVGLSDRWSYFDAHKGEWLGPKRRAALDFLRNADVILNVSGINPIREWTGEASLRVLIDTDPVFAQIKNIRNNVAGTAHEQHTHFLSFGQNIGSSDCTIPDDGRPWTSTNQPVDLKLWPRFQPLRSGRYTTVMQWDSYAGLSHQGVHFGTKSESMQTFSELVSRVPEVSLQLAVGGAGTAPSENSKGVAGQSLMQAG